MRRHGVAARVAARARAVRLVILDVDGVLTDGRILLDDRGREFKAFNVRDGYGIALLIRAGVRVAFLSQRRSAAVARRARELQVSAVVQGAQDKRAAAQQFTRRWRLRREQIAFVGDDLPDLPLLAVVGFAVTVADAPAEVKRRAHWVTAAGGGAGAVREVAELVLRSQGKWTSAFGNAAG